MTPREHYQAGELDRAITVLGEELRSKPLDPQRRTFLFELLCFAGQYDRAEKQLDVLLGGASAAGDPTMITGGPATAGLLAYRSALHAQRTREAMFLSNTLPATRVEPGGTGTCNGVAFRDFTDADPRIGDHLEVFVAGSYTWIPVCFVQDLQVERPEHLRDLLWARARLTLRPGAPFQDMGEIFLPALTALAHRSTVDAVRLGRVTVWEMDNGQEIPTGQKMYFTDEDESSFLEVKTVSWEGGTEQGEPVLHARA